MKLVSCLAGVLALVVLSCACLAAEIFVDPKLKTTGNDDEYNLEVVESLADRIKGKINNPYRITDLEGFSACFHMALLS